MKNILIDVGSSTVKVYEFEEGKLSHLFNRSIKFKEGFTPESGVSEANKTELVELLLEIKQKFPEHSVKIFATAIFRKYSEKAKVRFIDEIFIRTNIYFNIVSHELENFYIQKALVGKLNSTENSLIVNIGGGSIELVVMFGNEAIETHNIEYGIGNLLGEFEGINDDLSKIELETVISKVKSLLPQLTNKVTLAFYTGGELEYMKRANYQLEANTLFDDSDHPSLIKLENIQKKNQEIFTKTTLNELENLMPEDPKWMHGARGCSAIAQAIFEKYSIDTVIPSNSNLIDGVVRQQFRKVTISGSFRKHLEYIVKVRNLLVKNNIEVLSPRFTDPKNPGEEFVVFQGEEGLAPLELERHHLDSIDQSDALIVCSPAGYVGASALIEIGYANKLGKKIIFTEKPEEFMLNTLPSEISII